MGAKTWMLVASSVPVKGALLSNPEPNPDSTDALVQALFPTDSPLRFGDRELSYSCPPDDEIFAGCYPGVDIVAASEFGIDYPSKLPERFLARFADRDLVLHAMHSSVDWFAFAVWKQGNLVRSLSLSPDSGVLEDIGPRLDFEIPYWNGQHPATEPGEEDDYPFVFHPLELGEAALRHFFGYQLEGFVDPELLESDNVTLLHYRRNGAQSPPTPTTSATHKPWWRFW